MYACVSFPRELCPAHLACSVSSMLLCIHEQHACGMDVPGNGRCNEHHWVTGVEVLYRSQACHNAMARHCTRLQGGAGQQPRRKKQSGGGKQYEGDFHDEPQGRQRGRRNNNGAHGGRDDYEEHGGTFDDGRVAEPMNGLLDDDTRTCDGAHSFFSRLRKREEEMDVGDGVAGAGLLLALFVQKLPFLHL